MSQERNSGSSGESPIIFFDGVCVLCNTFLSVMLRADRRRIFRFAPIQGETARSLLPPLGEDPALWSMVYLDEAGLHDQSDAPLEVFRRLGGIWAILGWLRFVPRGLRDLAYRFVARHRYRLLGKRDQCRVATDDERARFLP